MIVLYRKSADKVRKLTAAERKELDRELTRARVQRPGIVDLFASGAFDKLGVLTPAQVKDRPGRILDHEGEGWVVPMEDYARLVEKGADEQNIANSIKLWIQKNLEGIAPEGSFSLVVEDA